jgi:FKBP-type peptidyl-prolyl cis-trans isomerase SlyD
MDNLTLVANNMVVSFHYTLKNASGEVLDSSIEAQPLTYLHGYGQIVPGLENALLGKASGSAVKVTVAPEEGYGAYRDELVISVPRKEVGLPDGISVGSIVELHSSQGESFPARVTELTEEQVVLDANHPLAGESLFFEVELTAIRPATTEEIEHGHVHGPGGHHH